MMLSLDDIRNFLKNVLIPITTNPGEINISACLILGGFGLWALSAILCQVGVGPVDPMVAEIGKAAFYTGLGSAAQKTANNKK